MSASPFTILLVDDSQTIVEMWTAHLRHAGYRVESAAGGRQAVDIVSRQPIDLILLDVIMPGLDGYEALEQIRESYPPSVLPVIVASSKDASEDMVRAFDLGANDYVTKPFDRDILLARIQAQLRSRIPARVAVPEIEVLPTEMGPGTVLDDKYRLDSLIDRGNFGAVYRGTHLGLGRPVAIKLLAATVGKDPASLLRFQHEGISACRIRHPNAVAVHDFNITGDGVPYLVMELLEGHTLEEELRRNPTIPPHRIAQILLPICQVLTKAHGLGIIHRDIKPQNIFLHRDRHGEWIKVLDFGIAKIVGEAALNQRLTQEGSLVGTPIYMAPERLLDLPYNGSSDIYSLGVIIYEALTGRKPFATGADSDLLQIIQLDQRRRPPSLVELHPGLPPTIDRLVQETLDSDPAGRPSAAQLAARFLDALGMDPEPLPMNPTSPSAVADIPASAASPRQPPARSVETNRWWVKTLPDLTKE